MWPWGHRDFGLLACRAVRERMSVVSSQRVCSTLLQLSVDRQCPRILRELQSHKGKWAAPERPGQQEQGCQSWADCWGDELWWWAGLSRGLGGSAMQLSREGAGFRKGLGKVWTPGWGPGRFFSPEEQPRRCWGSLWNRRAGKLGLET